MLGDKYLLILEEKTQNFYAVSAPELPGFFSEVTGSFAFEAVERAKQELLRWLARQRDLKNDVPQGHRGGYILYAEGAHRTEDDVFWSKEDLRRSVGLSVATIDRRIRDGTFKAFKVGRRVLFDPHQIRKVIS